MINWLTFITFDGSRSLPTVWKCAQSRMDVNSLNIPIESVKKRVRLLIVNWNTCLNPNNAFLAAYAAWAPPRVLDRVGRLGSAPVADKYLMTSTPKTYEIQPPDLWDTTTRPMTSTPKMNEIQPPDQWHLRPRWMTSTSKMNDIQPPVLWHLHPTHMRYNHKTYDISPMTIISIEAEVPQSVSSLNKDPSR